MVAQRVEIGIDFDVVQEPPRHRFQSRFEHVQRRIRVLQMGRERAGEIIAHVEVVGIDQKRAGDPFFRSFRLTQNGEPINAIGESRSVAAILRDGLFGALDRDFGGALCWLLDLPSPCSR